MQTVTCQRGEPIMQPVGWLCQVEDGSRKNRVRTLRSFSLALVMIAGAGAAFAEGRPSVTMSLFGTGPAQAPKGEIKGMRPEAVVAVAYFPLSVDAANSLRSRSAPQQLQITLPGGGSVTCMLRAEMRPNGMVLLTGEPVGGEPGQSCSLVVANGHVTGELE